MSQRLITDLQFVVSIYDLEGTTLIAPNDGQTIVYRSGVWVNDYPIVPPPVNARSNADSYTVQPSDFPHTSGQVGIVTMNRTGANTVVIPSDNVLSLPAGSQLLVVQRGVGKTSVSGDGGSVQVVSASTLSCRARNSVLSVIKMGPNDWVLMGDMA